MKDLRDEMKNLESEVASLKKTLKDYEKFTGKFLKECSKLGLTKVSIGKKTEDKDIDNMGFPFGSRGSVWGNKEVRDSLGRPAIWNVVETLDISGGCGNNNQHQVNGEAKLLEGIYELKRGVWKRTD